MVKIMVGKKGSGKTKKMIDSANDQVMTSKGSIIFINNDKRLSRELNYRMRVVSAEDYQHLGNIDEFTGFILGIISMDHDIETIFIDSILKHADVSLGDLPEFIYRLEAISDIYDLNFVVSVSAEKEEMIGVNFDGCEILN